MNRSNKNAELLAQCNHQRYGHLPRLKRWFADRNQQLERWEDEQPLIFWPALVLFGIAFTAMVWAIASISIAGAWGMIFESLTHAFTTWP